MNYSTTNSWGTSSVATGVGHFLLFPAPHGGGFVAFCALLKLIPTYIPGLGGSGFTFTGALRSSENCIVGVASRSGRINQWQCSIPNFAIGCFFRFCFPLWQPSFHWIISDGVVNGIGRNGNVLILPTPIPSSLWLRSDFRFSLGHKLSYHYICSMSNLVPRTSTPVAS